MSLSVEQRCLVEKAPLLAVESQQVIPGQAESADVWLSTDTTMRPMPVCSGEAIGMVGRSVHLRCYIGAGVRTFAQARLDEAFGNLGRFSDWNL